MKKFTDEQLALRIWDREDLINLASRHAYCRMYDRLSDELDTLWVKKPENRDTASFGQDTGYFTGMNAIADFYAQIKQQSGDMLLHVMDTPLIEIAEDGETAQGMWYSPGCVTDGGGAKWVIVKYAIDFIKEDGEWKIWHLFAARDMVNPVGEMASEQPADIGYEGCVTTNLPMAAHTSKYNWPAYPPIPKPYRSFAETVSYGPEGNPNYKGGL